MTYREIARLVGRSPSTIWRRMNGRQPITRAQAIRELPFAMVLSFRGQDKSIRRVASKLAISRSAVERDLRLARRLAEQDYNIDYDIIEMARRALIVAQEPKGRR
jgi:IS30 family transposase